MRRLPVPPPERRLPDHGRRREELLRMIGQTQGRGRWRWGLPLGVAAAVSATGVIAALAFGGGAARTAGGAGVGPLAGRTPTPSATGPTVISGDGKVTSVVVNGTTITVPYGTQDFMAACRAALAKQPGEPPKTPGSTPPPIDPKFCAADRPSQFGGTPAIPGAPIITAPPQTPLAADRAAAILASCAPTDGPWRAVIAVATAIATPNQDAVVIGTNAKHEYMFCSGLASVGRPDRGPGPDGGGMQLQSGPVLEAYNGADTRDGRNILFFNLGLARPDVTRVTVSYGTDKQEYPALLYGGAYLLTTSTPNQHPGSGLPPTGYVHAYAADGSKLYDTPLH